MSHGFKTGMIPEMVRTILLAGALQNGDVRNRNSRHSICEVPTATPLPAIAFGQTVRLVMDGARWDEQSRGIDGVGRHRC
jgi:hypothetical protein